MPRIALTRRPDGWINQRTNFLAGVIPIIKKFPGDDIYRGLPVVIVNDWREDTLEREEMERSRNAEFW